MLTIGPAPERAIEGERFDENRIGLDPISFSVGHRDDLTQAMATLDEQGVPRGEIKDLPPFQIYVLAFRDPDNIQVDSAEYGLDALGILQGERPVFVETNRGRATLFSYLVAASFMVLKPSTLTIYATSDDGSERPASGCLDIHGIQPSIFEPQPLK